MSTVSLLVIPFCRIIIGLIRMTFIMTEAVPGHRISLFLKLTKDSNADSWYNRWQVFDIYRVPSLQYGITITGH